MPTLTDRLHSGQQFASSMFFNYVAQRPYAEGFLHNIGRELLTQEKYLGFGGEFADSLGRFDSIQRWQPDIQENQVGLQFFRFANRFYSV